MLEAIAFAGLLIAAGAFATWLALRKCKSCADNNAEVERLTQKLNILEVDYGAIEDELKKESGARQAAEAMFQKRMGDITDMRTEANSRIDQLQAELKVVTAKLKKAQAEAGLYLRIRPYFKSSKDMRDTYNSAVSRYNRDAKKHLEQIENGRSPSKWKGQVSPVTTAPLLKK